MVHLNHSSLILLVVADSDVLIAKAMKMHTWSNVLMTMKCIIDKALDFESQAARQLPTDAHRCNMHRFHKNMLTLLAVKSATLASLPVSSENDLTHDEFKPEPTQFRSRLSPAAYCRNQATAWAPPSAFEAASVAF